MKYSPIPLFSLFLQQVNVAILESAVWFMMKIDLVEKRRRWVFCNILFVYLGKIEKGH